MKRANKLVYKYFKSTNKGFRFYYQIDDKEHSFYLSSHLTKIKIDDKSKRLVLFHIGLSFLVDIAVICCPRKIIIKPLYLSNEQLNFWKWVYEEISLEKAYVEKQKLHFSETTWELDKLYEQHIFFKKHKELSKLTIAMSGGKEFLTALKLFKNYPDIKLLFLDDYEKTSFHLKKVIYSLSTKMEYYCINTNISHTAKLTKEFEGIRDKKYTFTIGQLIFSSLLFSDKIDYLMIGNEYSANFGNAKYKSRVVNHQFDKTIQFAERINNYIKKYFNKVILYTSPFFGIYEYRIAELFFSGDKDYLNIWTSCNNSNSKHNFCCKCPKCAFIYIISLPFVENFFLDKYFFENPLEKLKLCKPLIDINSEKPTDCVGEKKECWVALYKIIEQNKASKSKVVRYFKKEILPKIEQYLPKMELEITSEQTKYKYLPKKLLKYLPVNFFNTSIRRSTSLRFRSVQDI